MRFADAARDLGHDKLYAETYWSRFPGMYFAGDGAKKDENGDIWLLGRVEDVMNISGHRISTTEVESALGVQTGTDNCRSEGARSSAAHAALSVSSAAATTTIPADGTPSTAMLTRRASP